MKKPLTSKFIQDSLSITVWDFSNQVLYDLCASHPTHVKDDVIIAKVWLIGRSYAAAIERRKNKKITDSSDKFYEHDVAHKIYRSKIDHWFNSLSEDKELGTALSLQIHKKLTDLFSEISGDNKRSLASKYLHFHFPERFYIYDSRAQKSITELTDAVGNQLASYDKFDNVYARFFLRCQSLNKTIKGLIGCELSPRELDKVLLESGQVK